MPDFVDERIARRGHFKDKSVLRYLRDMVKICRYANRRDLRIEYEIAWDFAAETIYGRLPGRRVWFPKGKPVLPESEPHQQLTDWQLDALKWPERKIVRSDDNFSLLDCGHRIFRNKRKKNGAMARCGDCYSGEVSKKKPAASVRSVARKAALAVIVLFAIGAHAQDATPQDAQPRMQVAVMQLQRNFLKVSEGKVAYGARPFFDGPRITSTAVNFSLRTLDNVETCRALASGHSREEVFNTQKCSVVSVYTAGFMFGSLALERMLYKHHPKLARIPQWVSAAGSGEGISYTATHGGIQ